MRRLATIISTTALTLAVTASTALAQNGGEGLYGEADDKVVTSAGFILIIAFPLLILLFSLIQGRLEKRKDARKKAAKAAGGDDRWKSGW